MQELRKTESPLLQWRVLTIFAVWIFCFSPCSGADAPVPPGKPTSYPAWWFKREVIRRTNPANTNPAWPADYPQVDDYAVLNQGQLKWLTEQAAAELPGNGGPNVREFLDGFRVVNLTQVAGVTAAQSSTGWDAPASRAIDDNTDGNYYNNSVTHTNYDVNPWWQVDLGASRTIHNIEIWNRTDCCGDRSSNFYLFISSADMSGRSLSNLLADTTIWKSTKITGYPNPNLTISVGAHTGRYVMMRIDGNQYLSLAEVKVNGNVIAGRSAVDNYAVANVGQLKAMATPLYNRLSDLGLVSAYPWSQSGSAPDNYAVANVGQAKNVFSFSYEDSDGDGVIDVLETQLGRNPQDASDANADSDGDGTSDLDELLAGLNPFTKDGSTLKLSAFGFTTP